MKKNRIAVIGALLLGIAAADMGLSYNVQSYADTGVMYAPGIQQRSQTGPGAQSSTLETQSAPDSSTQTVSKNNKVELAAAPGTVQGAAQAVQAVNGGTQGTAAQTAAQQSTGTGSTAQSTAQAAASGSAVTKNGYKNGDQIGLSSAWKYADYSAINSGKAVMYTASSNRKNKIVAVNAGHGTKGGSSVKTYCHPDKTAKLTGGSTAAGAVKATAVSSGMTFNDGTAEATVTLQMARILKDKLLAAGYDVLMIRNDTDVQLDNIARTVIANNTADIHIALHWDSDGMSSIKGVFYMSVPDGLKSMEPVASHWQQHEALGNALVAGLKAQGMKVWNSGALDMDLTQTSYSTIPSVDIELGNQCSNHSESILKQEADGLLAGINSYFGLK